MPSFRLSAASAAIIASLLFATACANEEPTSPAPAEAVVETPVEMNNIVQTASANPDFSTLVAAVQAAGLVETLSGEGPYTVFAPTNAAFGKLPAGTVDTLVQPANRAQLSGILTYHVVPGHIKAADVLAAIEAGGGSAALTTVQGGPLTATLDGTRVKLTDARGGVSYVTTTDLEQSNGVIHVIDTVLMPSA